MSKVSGEKGGKQSPCSPDDEKPKSGQAFVIKFCAVERRVLPSQGGRPGPGRDGGTAGFELS